MSLVRDYQHYYAGSWVALIEGDLLIPIFVETVIDESDYSNDDFSEEHRSRLLIHGHRYDRRDGRTRGSRINISVMSPDLVLESPDVGYVCSGRDIRWSVIRPIRQRLKGMASNKLHGANLGRGSDSASLVYDLFNPSFPGLVNRWLFVNPDNNKIHYKGAEVGLVVENEIRLLPRFQYIAGYFRNCPTYANFSIGVL